MLQAGRVEAELFQAVGSWSRRRVIARRAIGACVLGLVLKLHEHRTVKLGLALLHDDVDNTTESAAVLGLHAPTLDLDLLNEVEGHFGVGVATDQIGRLLSFNQIGVLGVGAASDRIAKKLTVAAIARRNAAAFAIRCVVLPSSGSLRAEGAN